MLPRSSTYVQSFARAFTSVFLLVLVPVACGASASFLVEKVDTQPALKLVDGGGGGSWYLTELGVRSVTSHSQPLCTSFDDMMVVIAGNGTPI